MKNLVVFASGTGSNFQAIIDSIKEGTLDAGIAGLITDRPDIGAIERAKSESIPVYTIKYDTQSSYSEQLVYKLDEWKPDLIILAGYLKKIPVAITEKYPNQIINIHPSLLPKYGGKGFYGLNVHKAVLEASEKESGCTVHFVNEFYDQGDIIEQKKVPVSPDDTPESLARKVLKEEHKLLPKVIAEILNSN